MYSAMLSACEVWYARSAGRNVEGALTVHMRDMKLAMEQDGMNPMSGRRTYTYRYPEGMEMPYASTGTGQDALDIIHRTRRYGHKHQSQWWYSNNQDPDNPSNFLTTDKPHSLGYFGPPMEKDEPWLSPEEVSYYAGKCPTNSE